MSLTQLIKTSIKVVKVAREKLHPQCQDTDDTATRCTRSPHPGDNTHWATHDSGTIYKMWGHWEPWQ
jgi:hypothetical protein